MSAGALRYEGAPSRRAAILDQVRASGFCSVADLAGALGVSEMTVRRDARLLDTRGEVRLVHGGLSLPPGSGVSEFASRETVSPGPKARIASASAALVGPRDAIAVDAGTTAHAVVRALPDAFTGCVVTHSVPVMEVVLAGPVDRRCVGLGGDLYPPSRAFVGPATVEAAAHLRVRWFFLGAAAVDERGCYGAADLERPTKRALMDIADNVVLLVDATKFSTSAPVLLTRFAGLRAVVTDAPPPRGVRAALDRAEAELIIAG